MGQRLTRAELAIILAGGLALVASFLTFYTSFLPDGDAVSSWDPLLFPLATLIALFAIVAAALVALTRFAHVSPSRRRLGVSIDQIIAALCFNTAVLALAFLFARRGGSRFGVGYYLLLVAALASVAGGYLLINEVSSRPRARRGNTRTGRGGISAGDIVIVVAAVVALIASVLPFYDYETFLGSAEYTLWSRDFPFMFPVATLLLLYTIASAFMIAIKRQGAGPYPGSVLGIGPNQLCLILSVSGLLLALAFLVQDRDAVVELELGPGYYLLLAACAGSTLGAVLLQIRRPNIEAV